MSTNGTVVSNGAKPARVTSLIWSIAELLRGDVRPADYGSYILPFTVLRRIDCVLESRKDKVVAVAKAIKDLDNVNLEQHLALETPADSKSYNVSPLTLTTVLDDPNHVRANVEADVEGFSSNEGFVGVWPLWGHASICYDPRRSLTVESRPRVRRYSRGVYRSSHGDRFVVRDGSPS